MFEMYILVYYIYIYIYMVSCPVLTDPPPMVWGGGVGTRIRYTHCISTLCRLSTLPQYYKPPPHHRRGWGILYTTTIPQTTPTPQGGGNPLLPPPMGGEGGGDRPTLHHIYRITSKEKVFQTPSDFGCQEHAFQYYRHFL